MESKTESVSSDPWHELRTVRSWIYVTAFSLTSLITWGTIAAFPILFVAFLERFDESRLLTSAIGSFQVGFLFMLTVIPGYFIPRYGYQVNILIGCGIMTIGFISTIFVEKIYYIYITIGLLTSLGASFLLVASDNAPLVVFNESRSLVTVVKSTAISIGFTIMPLGTNYMLETYGLQGTLLLWTGIILQCVVLSMYFPSESSMRKIIGKVDAESAGENTLKTAKEYINILKSPSFWCLEASLLAIGFLSNSCRIFLLDRSLLQEIPRDQAVFAMSSSGIAGAIARFFVQIPIINKTPTRRQITYAIMTLAWSIVTILFVLTKTFIGLLLYCLAEGSLHGLCAVLWYLILADTREKRLLVPAFSLHFFITGPVIICGVPLAGLIYDYSRSYVVPYIIYGCLGILTAICVVFLPYFEKREKAKAFRMSSDT